MGNKYLPIVNNTDTSVWNIYFCILQILIMILSTLSTRESQ